jgi:hypothetical protein
VDTHANTASAAATSVDARVNTISNQVSIISALVFTSVSARSVGVSTKGLQSALNALSNTMSATRSAVSNVSATSAGGGSATGLQAVIDALSNKISTIVAGSQSVTSAEYVSTLSVVSHLASIVSNVSAQSAGGSATGLQNVINMLSNKISQAGGGAGSVTSNEASAISAQAASALSAAKPMTRVVEGNQTISSSALTNVSGLCVALSAGVLYKMEAFLFITKGAAGTPIKYGLTFPAMTRIRGKIYNAVSNAQSVGGVITTGTSVAQYFGQHANFEGDSASGSVLLSTVSAALLSTFGVYNAVMRVSTAGNIVIQAAGAGGASAIVVQPDSYIQVFKIA